MLSKTLAKLEFISWKCGCRWEVCRSIVKASKSIPWVGEWNTHRSQQYGHTFFLNRTAELQLVASFLRKYWNFFIKIELLNCIFIYSWERLLRKIVALEIPSFFNCFFFLFREVCLIPVSTLCMPLLRMQLIAKNFRYTSAYLSDLDNKRNR